MNWRERIKPSNESEAGCYRFVLVVVTIVLVLASIRLLHILNVPRGVTLGLAFVGVFAWLTYIIRSDLLADFPIPNLQALWLSLLSAVIMLLLFFLLMTGLSRLVNALGTILPNRASETLQIGGFLILVIAITKIRKTIESFLLRYLLNSSTGEESN